MTQRGFVSMRNEDGTQWASLAFGMLQWCESKKDANLISKEVFDIMEADQEATRFRDCPDNGFFGVYNLKFHPV